MNEVITIQVIIKYKFTIIDLLIQIDDWKLSEFEEKAKCIV